jgi:hypothetical protein
VKRAAQARRSVTEMKKRGDDTEKRERQTKNETSCIKLAQTKKEMLC